MKKPHTKLHRIRLANNSRRRQLLKRAHQKVNQRRQNFQIIESTEE
ncbi:hypothetical protein [Paraglaciecola aestuariivivens]